LSSDEKNYHRHDFWREGRREIKERKEGRKEGQKERKNG
jgi:hypothetical protein